MFEPSAYRNFVPEGRQVVKEICDDIVPFENYYKSIKEHMASKECYKTIESRELKRVSCFADLDNSIRAAQKILAEIHTKLESEIAESVDISRSTGSLPTDISMSSNGSTRGMELIWLMMARWINFEFWFSYEKRPRI